VVAPQKASAYLNAALRGGIFIVPRSKQIP